MMVGIGMRVKKIAPAARKTNMAIRDKDRILE